MTRSLLYLMQLTVFQLALLGSHLSLIEQMQRPHIAGAPNRAVREEHLLLWPNSSFRIVGTYLPWMINIKNAHVTPTNRSVVRLYDLKKRNSIRQCQRRLGVSLSSVSNGEHAETWRVHPGSYTQVNTVRIGFVTEL